MKVIKAGRQQHGWSKEFECTGTGNGGGGCGATLLVEEADLFHTSRSSYDGETDYFVTFKCCSCGVLTDIKDYPRHARHLPSQHVWENTVGKLNLSNRS